MKRCGPTVCPLSRAHLFLLGAVQLAIFLFFLSPLLALLPIAVFSVLALVAPFVQRWQFYLPIVTRSRDEGAGCALTFDDGPDPATTPRLLDLLATRGVRATFFLVGKKAAAHPELGRAILEAGHEVGNHSHDHDVFLMLPGKDIGGQIQKCNEALEAFGVRPRAFRPPVGVTNPRLFRALVEEGMYCAGFSVRGGDRGNRRVIGIARRVLGRLRGGDVIALHDVSPKSPADVEHWLGEVAAAIDGAREKGFDVGPLSKTIGRPVMTPAGEETQRATSAVYDAMAEDYDAEQASGGQSALRRAEVQRFHRYLRKHVRPGARVLEIGAGTGRFTMFLAQKAGEVVAVDASPGMLAVLADKTRDLPGVRPVLADACRFEPEGSFDSICSLSALEYVPNAGEVVGRLAASLKPGGTLYIVTAHRTLFRLFVQIGNAMRQGLWLHARSRREVERWLEDAGLVDVQVLSTGLRSPISSGMLVEGIGRKPD